MPDKTGKDGKRATRSTKVDGRATPSTPAPKPQRQPKAHTTVTAQHTASAGNTDPPVNNTRLFPVSPPMATSTPGKTGGESESIISFTEINTTLENETERVG